MQDLELIKSWLKEAFPKTFSATRFPFTYHHDYGRIFYPEYKDFSRSEVATALDDRLGDNFDAYWYELIHWATLYLIHSSPNEFASVIASNEQFWRFLEDIRTFERFQQNLL